MGNIPMGMSGWEAHIAIKNNRISSIQEGLKSKNLNPNLRFQGETLLTTAIKQNNSQIVLLLLSNGANTNLRSPEGGRNEPPLISATRLKLFKMAWLLVENGAKLNQTNFYGHNAIYQAVQENAFDILEFFLQKCNHADCGHQNISVCPLMAALKDSPIYPLKKQCLLILLKYNYYCPCLRPEIGIFSEIYEYEFYYEPYEKDPDILKWIYLSKGFRVHFMKRIGRRNSLLTGNENLADPLRLMNFTRIVIRDEISKAAYKRNGNFVTFLLQLPLPKKITNFLLMDDLQVT